MRNYIREDGLLRAGDRVGVAVSGGADSVALLRALLELGAELGVVLSVVHLHHGIRGEEADADAEFVRELAAAHGLDLHLKREDAPTYARKHRLGLEAAGRALRYRYFDELVSAGTLEVVATAHNSDDQAETVLLRFLRGAWTRGLGGIYPRAHGGRVIRPLLGAPRTAIIAYLDSIGQPWCEDQSNTDRDFLRNRVRHELLPLLESDYSPGVRDALGNLAALARNDHDYWTQLTRETQASLVRDVAAQRGLDFDDLIALPLALHSRVLIAEAHSQLDLRLEFAEVESLLALAVPNAPRRVQLRGGFAEVVRREGRRLLQFRGEAGMKTPPASYEYRLPIPGEAHIPELKAVVRARMVTATEAGGAYNPATLLNSDALGAELVVRNWRAGDRFRPLRARSEEKVKRLLQEKKIVHPEKALWPVVLSGDRIVWIRGLAVAADFAGGEDGGPAVVIEFEAEGP